MDPSDSVEKISSQPQGEKQPPNKKEVKRLVAINLLLAVAVAAVVLCLLVPRLTAAKAPNLANSDWVIEMANDRLQLPGVDFYDTAAVTYTPEGVNLHVSYASQEDVTVMRGTFRELMGLPISEDETDTIIIASYVDGAPVAVSSAFEEICYIYSVVMGYPEEKEAQRLTKIVDEAYPEELVTGNAELAPLITEVYGSFIFYEHDKFDSVRYPDVPQYSRAYYYEGDTAAFDAMALQMAEGKADSVWNAASHMLIFEQDGWRYALTLVPGQQGNLVSIGLQQIPPQA